MATRGVTAHVPDEHYRPTHEALAEVDFGKTVEHADVEAWAAQLNTARRKRRRKIRPAAAELPKGP